MLATFYNVTALLGLCEALPLTQDLEFMVQNIAVVASENQRQVHTIIYVSQEYKKTQRQLQIATLLNNTRHANRQFDVSIIITSFWRRLKGSCG